MLKTISKIKNLPKEGEKFMGFVISFLEFSVVTRVSRFYTDRYTTTTFKITFSKFAAF